MAEEIHYFNLNFGFLQRKFFKGRKGEKCFQPSPKKKETQMET